MSASNLQRRGKQRPVPPVCVVGGCYQIVKKIGAGSFGDVYLGLNGTTGEEVAIKLEHRNSLVPQIEHEARLYQQLQGRVGVARIKWSGQEGDYNVLVVELLGPSLEDVFNHCKRKFTLKTVLMLADQMLCRIKDLHSKNFVHRDIKPENFLMGIYRNSSILYLIDYGLSKRYRDPRNNRHIVYHEGKSLIGNGRFASINSHRGTEQSRRDDLISLGYMLIYFMKGTLPWQGLQAATTKQSFEKILQKKLSTSVEALCRNTPPEFEIYMKYCTSVKFDEEPHYAYLQQLFRVLFRILNYYQNDSTFDWTARLSMKASYNEKIKEIESEQTENTQDLTTVDIRGGTTAIGE